MRKFLSIFGGSARQKANPAPGAGNIDLRTLAGSMAREEAPKLNGQTPKRPTRPAATPDGAVPRGHQAGPPPRRREESMPEPPPSAQTRRPIPAEAREARSPPETRAPDTRAPGGAPAAPGRVPAGRGQAPQGRDDGFARQPPREGYLATFGLEKSFGNRKVVRGPSIYVRRGEAVGLLGPNGAGKTTVFYMITGLIKPDRGRIELDGHDITQLPMYQRARLGIGYLPQEASIFRGLNVEDNIRAVLEVDEPNRRKREADLDALLEEFDITRLRKTPEHRALGRRAAPRRDRARAGDAAELHAARRAVRRHRSDCGRRHPDAGAPPDQRGIGVLITDHNVRETLALTDRAYIIYSGEVLREGRAGDIVNDPEVRRLYLGEEFRM